MNKDIMSKSDKKNVQT